jgi:hypothetical protein
VQGERVTMAGDGVSTYDLPIVRRVFPKTGRRFTYFTLDTSVVRRWMTAAGIAEVERTPSMHRAEGDVRNAIEWAQRVAVAAHTRVTRICAECLDPIIDGDDFNHVKGRSYHAVHLWPTDQPVESPEISDTTSSGT